MSRTARGLAASFAACAVVGATAAGCASTSPQPCECPKVPTATATAQPVGPAAQPAELKPVMRELLVDLAAVQGTLDSENTPQAHGHAVRMTQSWAEAKHASGGSSAHGALFEALHAQLDDALAGLVDATSAGDLHRARQHYGSVVGTCLSCHAQAPAAAGRVWLGRLLQGAGPD